MISNTNDVFRLQIQENTCDKNLRQICLKGLILIMEPGYTKSVAVISITAKAELITALYFT